MNSFRNHDELFDFSAVNWTIQSDVRTLGSPTACSLPGVDYVYTQHASTQQDPRTGRGKNIPLVASLGHTRGKAALEVH